MRRRLARLLPSQHFLPQHLLHQSQIVRLPVDDILEILDVLPQFLDLGFVELHSIIRGLLDIEASAYVHENMFRVCELPGDVQRRGERD